ncbi:MAG: hypothetical protein LPK09_06280 [Hymenobacteraceae bacterium]|nr:hypothetical protein [Hymenobacteraceae bacterium]
MNKNVLAVFAAVCGLFMISCGTSSDQRPSTKVSVSTVPAGMRSTYNVSDAAGEVGHAAHGHEAGHDQIMPNHDAGVNTIEKGDSISEAATTLPEGADKD